MKHLLLSLVLILLTTPASATIAFVQQRINGNSSSSASSLAYNSNIANGSLLLVCVAWTATVTLNSIADNIVPNTSFTLTTARDNAGNIHVRCGYGISGAAGADTVTVTFSGTTASTYGIWEYSGTATSGTILDVQNGATGNSASPASGSITPAGNNEFIFGWMGNPNQSSAPTASGSFTARLCATNAGIPDECGEEQIQTTATTVNATFTITSNQWAASILAFCPAAGCGGAGGGASKRKKVIFY